MSSSPASAVAPAVDAAAAPAAASATVPAASAASAAPSAPVSAAAPFVADAPNTVYPTAEGNELKCFLFLLKGMGAGKAVSQAAHAVRVIVSDLTARSTRVLCNPMLAPQQSLASLPEPCVRFQRWSLRDTVIALAATAEQLDSLASLPEAVAIVDREGDKYVPAGTLVCVGFPPRASDSMKSITSQLKLFA